MKRRCRCGKVSVDFQQHSVPYRALFLPDCASVRGFRLRRLAVTSCSHTLQESLGVPVIAVGIPTVVDSATIVMDAMEKMLEGEEGVDVVKYMSRQQPPFPELNNMYMTGKDIE